MAWQTIALLMLAAGSLLMAIGFWRDTHPAPSETASDEADAYGDASMLGRE